MGRSGRRAEIERAATATEFDEKHARRRARAGADRGSRDGERAEHDGGVREHGTHGGVDASDSRGDGIHARDGGARFDAAAHHARIGCARAREDGKRENGWIFVAGDRTVGKTRSAAKGGRVVPGNFADESWRRKSARRRRVC